MRGNENDGRQQKHTSYPQSNVKIRGLDFSSIDSVINRSAVHYQHKKTKEKGTAAYKFKKVKSSAQSAL